jgi:hypothetical protein
VMSRHHRNSLNKLEFEKSTRIDLTINKMAARKKQGERRAHFLKYFRASTKKVQFHHENYFDVMMKMNERWRAADIPKIYVRGKLPLLDGLDANGK